VAFQSDAFQSDAFQVEGTTQDASSLFLSMSIVGTFMVDGMPSLSIAGEGSISDTFTVDGMPSMTITDPFARGWRIYVED
jgi:hypothetical protein